MGYFEVLRPAPEKLAQKPEEDSSNDRTRQGSVPRLARLLWRLLHISGLNRVPPLTEDHADHSISDEFRTLSAAAAKVEIAPGIELRSEEHTSELQSLMRISYAVFCLKKKKHK